MNYSRDVVIASRHLDGEEGGTSEGGTIERVGTGVGKKSVARTRAVVIAGGLGGIILAGM